PGVPEACACHSRLGFERVAVSDDVLAKLKSVSIPTISQILRRRGVGNAFLSGVAPRTPLQSLVGRAFTARALPTRQDVAATQAGAASLHRRAFETIRPGDVLVIDARGDVGARVTGDILATRAPPRSPRRASRPSARTLSRAARSRPATCWPTRIR